MSTKYIPVDDIPAVKDEQDKAPVTTPANNNNDEIAELRKQNEALRAQLELITKMIGNMGGTGAPAPVSARDREITVIHLIQCGEGLATCFKLTNREIQMKVMGETRILSLSEAEEMASKFRKFFEKGVIAFASKDEDFAKKFDLARCVVKDAPDANFTDTLGGLDCYALEKYFKEASEAKKALIIETFKHKIIDGDTRFKDTGKIQLLERLTTKPGEIKGAMEGVLVDLQNEANRKKK